MADSTERGATLRILIAACAIVMATQHASAQSILTGTISGTVRDELGRPMGAAHVVLTELNTGWQRDREVGGNGRFGFWFLPPGTYGVFAEQIGYRPKRIRDIRIESGRSATVEIDLRPAEPPVDSVDVLEFRGDVRGVSLVASGARFSSFEFGRLPARSRELAEVGRFSTTSSKSLATEGLPGRLTGVMIDGIPYGGTARHPDLADSAGVTAPFPFLQFRTAELISGAADVEYGGVTGAILSGHTVQGTRSLRLTGYGDWSGDELAQSDHFDPRRMAITSLRAGALVTGPLIRDTAHFVIGVEARRVETPFPRAWTVTASDSALLAVGSDSFAVDLGGYLRPRLEQADLLSSFVRLDGQINERNTVTFRGNVAALSVENAHIGTPPFSSLRSKLDGTDANGAVQFTSILGEALGMELRLGLEYSKREYRSGALPPTVFADGTTLGDDPGLPGRFERIRFHGSETFHVRLGAHQLKFGGSVSRSSFDHTYLFGRVGAFAFGGVADFAELSGSFVQSVGRTPAVRFETSEVGGFIQNRWTATAGVELTAGFRIDAEYLPDGDVPSNSAWFDQTGLRNDAFDHTITKFSPRFGLRWDVGNRRRWLVQAQAGVYHGTVDPGAFGEVVTQSGDARVRRGAGQLDRWPAAPDSTTAPLGGVILTLPGRSFEAPRTFRASLGARFMLDADVILDMSAAYRHTDFLPRRHDLNLSAAPSGRDQFGRPVYGTLVQRGSALAVEPESNRRFGGFDTVSSLDADGVSDYWGLTARVERRVDDWLTLVGSYTFSRTEDNLLFARGARIDVSPFPSGLGEQDWADGRSDFDIPHRVVVGAELDFGILGLAGFFRHQSGLPFTPGFRPGVDANGDGSFQNDPAFIDDAIPGVAELVDRWRCVRRQIGRFAKRNSCRGHATNTLDLRLSVRLVTLADRHIELTADALNVLDPATGLPDNALYLVDPAGSLTIDPATGDVNVPLLANPNFGREVQSFATGRFLRVGLKVGS